MTVHGAFRGNVRDDLGWLNTAGRPDPSQTFHRANLPRVGLSDVAPLTSGVMTSAALYLVEDDLVSNLTVISGATAAATPTNYWVALYNAAGALMSQSADQTSTAWAADTAKTLALGAAQRIPKSGLYYVGICVAAGTVPTLVGCAAAKPTLTGEVNLAQTSGTGLTTTAPATIATPTFKRACPLVIAS